MLLAIMVYLVGTIYAAMLWYFSEVFREMGPQYKKWEVPSLLMGSAIFAVGEIWLISKFADYSLVNRSVLGAFPVFAVTLLSALITAWGTKKYNRFSKKTAVTLISALAIIIGYL